MFSWIFVAIGLLALFPHLWIFIAFATVMYMYLRLYCSRILLYTGLANTGRRRKTKVGRRLGRIIGNIGLKGEVALLALSLSMTLAPSGVILTVFGANLPIIPAWIFIAVATIANAIFCVVALSRLDETEQPTRNDYLQFSNLGLTLFVCSGVAVLAYLFYSAVIGTPLSSSLGAFFGLIPAVIPLALFTFTRSLVNLTIGLKKSLE